MPTTPIAGSFSPEQWVTDPTGLISAMNQFNGIGARLVLTAGQVYTARFDLLTGPITEFLTIEGNAPADGSGVQGAIVQITGVGAANTGLQYVTFRRITFTAPSLLATASWLNGSMNQHIMFEDCNFIDFRPTISLNSGDDLRFYRCRVTQSSTPPASMNPNILGPGGLLIIKDCYINWDAQRAGGGSPALVGFGTYSNGSPGPWWIEDNQILPTILLPGFSGDAAIDIGSSGTNFAHCWIARNLIRNSKIKLVTGDDVWIRENTHILDASYYGPPESAFIVTQDLNGSPAPLGEIHIEENSILDLTSGIVPGRTTHKLNFVRDGYVRGLYIHRNHIYYASPTFAAPPPPLPPPSLGVINCQQTLVNSIGWGLLSICDNVFGCVDKDNAGGRIPAIHIDGQNAAPWDRIIIRGNRGLGVGPASAILPATLAQGYAYLFDMGAAVGTTAVNDLSIEDNDLGSGTFKTAWFNRTGATPVVQVQYRKNFPREGNDGVTLHAAPFTFTYTHGATNLAALGTPATGPAFVTVLGGNSGPGGSLTLNGTPISGANAPFNFVQLLTVGDVLMIAYLGTGAVIPILKVAPAKSTL